MIIVLSAKFIMQQHKIINTPMDIPKCFFHNRNSKQINFGSKYFKVKSVRLETSGPYFPAFGLNKGKIGKIGTRKTPNTDTFHSVIKYEND